MSKDEERNIQTRIFIITKNIARIAETYIDRLRIVPNREIRSLLLFIFTQRRLSKSSL